jgi:hypothetical protein
MRKCLLLAISIQVSQSGFDSMDRTDMPPAAPKEVWKNSHQQPVLSSFSASTQRRLPNLQLKPAAKSSTSKMVELAHTVPRKRKHKQLVVKVKWRLCWLLVAPWYNLEIDCSDIVAKFSLAHHGSRRPTILCWSKHGGSELYPGTQ